jgi:hypothetical protein
MKQPGSFMTSGGLLLWGHRKDYYKEPVEDAILMRLEL